MSEFTPKNPDHFKPAPGETEDDKYLRIQAENEAAGYIPDDIEKSTEPERQFAPGKECTVSRSGIGLESGWTVVKNLDGIVTLQKKDLHEGEIVIAEKEYPEAELLQFEVQADMQRLNNVEDVSTDEGRARDEQLAAHYGIDIHSEEAIEGLMRPALSRTAEGTSSGWMYNAASVNHETGVARVWNMRTGAARYINAQELSADYQDKLKGQYEKEVALQAALEQERAHEMHVQEAMADTALEAVGVQEPTPVLQPEAVVETQPVQEETQADMYDRWQREAKAELDELYAAHRQVQPGSWEEGSLVNQINEKKKELGEHARNAAKARGNTRWS